MKKFGFVVACCLVITVSPAQTVNQKLQKAFQQFENDPQLKHAISSLYVINAKTRKVVFDKNSQVGLTPASTQKIITSATAFELLGREYRYKTELGYTGEIKNGILDSNLYITGTCDPTFGSWRFAKTTESNIIEELKTALIKKGINQIDGLIYIDEGKFGPYRIPDGWIWQDIGNYYGAGACALNWRENQFDIILQSGKSVGEMVEIKKIEPEIYDFDIYSDLVSAEANSGDNAYIYFVPYAKRQIIKGTIPVNNSNFRISGAVANPPGLFLEEFKRVVSGKVKFKHIGVHVGGNQFISNAIRKELYTHYSPSLDSIIYWLNKKSINLYAEALIKTFAYEKKGFGSTDSGVAIVKDFWKQKGLDEDELNICDGSGLSPQNRVTTHAQVEILKYARTKDWFSYFYNSLPDYNGMRMKSGTIKDVKGYCGYHKAKDGTEYIFSFLVNNYNGSSSGLVNKMYKVLDVLK